jgi:hypothetical protein
VNMFLLPHLPPLLARVSHHLQPRSKKAVFRPCGLRIFVL